MRAISKYLLCALLVLSAGNVFAEGNEFYKRGGEGWFWYIDPEPEPEPEEKEEEEIPIVTPPEKPKE